jgi:peptidyl-prolyl cis-trans isomerase SurA
MMKYFAYVTLVIMSFISVSLAQRSDSIAAVVNGDVITYTDLYDRMDLVIKSSQMPDKKEFRAKLLPQVLTGMITEQVQIQEAKKLGLNVEKSEIETGFAELAKQNNLESEQFKSVLKKQNIRVETLEKQIEAQLAWGKVIQREIRPRVVLSPNEINTEVERLKSRQGQSEYNVAEIFLPINEKILETEVRTTANDLSKQLSEDIRKFPAAARQFSQSATSANGGIIGWVTPDQLSDEVAEIVVKMDVKSVSNPVKTSDGYTILFLRDKRIVDLSQGAAQEKLRVKIASFQLPNDDAEQKEIKQVAQIFARDVKGCLDINERVTKLKTAKLEEFNDLEANISIEIVNAIKNKNIGEVGTVIENSSSIIVPMLCGREGGASKAVEREVEGRMGMQRMDILQKRYLRDLITNSYIERRV